MPPAPEWTQPSDLDYRQQVTSLAQRPIWEKSALVDLHARTPDQEAALGSLVRRGTDAEVRLAAILGAGVDGDHPLGHAFWRRAALSLDEAQVLACLMAPITVPEQVLPMLAWIAVDPQRSLPQRAAACARLLDADQLGAWNLIRAILRTGTAEDVAGPGADWKRGGRYELPKRLLLFAIQDLLDRRGLAPTGFEPNAAWAVQLDQLADLEVSMRSLREGNPPPAPIGLAWVQLHALTDQGNPTAQTALNLLVGN